MHAFSGTVAAAVGRDRFIGAALGLTRLLLAVAHAAAGQLTPTERERRREIQCQMALLRRFIDPAAVLMEIGPRDCAVAFRAAAAVRHVYAVDVTERTIRDRMPPRNFTLVLSDGCSIPVPEASINVAFSHHLMEHLDPSDAWAQLGNIYRSLAPGGVYLCVTPNRLRAGRERGEERRAGGLRLAEYTAREIRWLFRAAGFAEVRFYGAVWGCLVRLPYRVLALVERVLEALPRTVARLIARSAPARVLLGLRVAGVKSPSA